MKPKRVKKAPGLLAAALLVSGSAAHGQYYTPMSQRCFTAQFWCMMPMAAPIGSNCYCNSAYGPIPGIVR